MGGCPSGLELDHLGNATSSQYGPATRGARAPGRVQFAVGNAGCEGVLSDHGATQAPFEGVPMSDKSPRQSMSKKSGKSIKQKRAEKRSKGSEETFSDKIHPKKK